MYRCLLPANQVGLRSSSKLLSSSFTISSRSYSSLSSTSSSFIQSSSSLNIIKQRYFSTQSSSTPSTSSSSSSSSSSTTTTTESNPSSSSIPIEQQIPKFPQPILSKEEQEAIRRFEANQQTTGNPTITNKYTMGSAAADSLPSYYHRFGPVEINADGTPTRTELFFRIFKAPLTVGKVMDFVIAADLSSDNRRRALIFITVLLSIYGLLLFYRGRDSTYVGDDYEFAEPMPVWLLHDIRTRLLSRLWGTINHIEFPRPIRSLLYSLWSLVFGVKTDEAELSRISDYPTMADFFSRKLRNGVRPIDDKASLVSPVDGTVMAAGPVSMNYLQGIKGYDYHVWELLGHELSQDTAKNLYYTILYLAPGDYHRIHSPVDMKLLHGMHFAGELLPVHPWYARICPGMFVRNERVVLEGQWSKGFFSLTPVGAYNVGSIRLSQELDKDNTFRTNQPYHDNHSYHRSYIRVPLYFTADGVVKCEPYQPPHAPLPNRYNTNRQPELMSAQESTASYERLPNVLPVPKTEKVEGITINKGQEVARFELGSTVVLLFELNDRNEQFEFNVRAGQKVQVGQSLGSITSKKKGDSYVIQPPTSVV